MMRRNSLRVLLGVLMLCAGLSSGVSVSLVQASGPRVTFEITDEPGAWFKNTAGPIAGTQSLAVATPGTEVRFDGKSNTVHTRTSLIFPTGAINMPFDTEPRKGSDTVILHTPGLYVFTCKIHPYMFGAVIVDDPSTTGLDLGEQISLVNGITVPTSSDLATRLLRTFFIATNPANWEDYTSAAPWHITYPSVDVRITGGAVANLDTVLSTRYGNDKPKRRSSIPRRPQWERSGSIRNLRRLPARPSLAQLRPLTARLGRQGARWRFRRST